MTENEGQPMKETVDAFISLFAKLRDRPAMFLLENSYVSNVAYVSGCDAATNYRLLSGFSLWIRRSYGHRGGALSWAAQIPDEKYPDKTMSDLSPDEEEVVIAELFEKLMAFLREQPPDLAGRQSARPARRP